MSLSRQPAVFVDRDDTLIDQKGYLRDPDQIRIIPGVPDALKRLRDAGFAVVIVTNQSGVARGYFTEAELQAVHERLQEKLAEKGAAVDAIYYCPYLDGREAVVEAYRRDSDLRKPAAGMLRKAATDLRLDLSRSWMIGDSTRDVQAGRAAGCRTILLGSGATDPEARPDHTMSNFPAAADFILRETRRQAEMQAIMATAARERARTESTAVASHEVSRRAPVSAAIGDSDAARSTPAAVPRPSVPITKETKPVSESTRVVAASPETEAPALGATPRGGADDRTAADGAGRAKAKRSDDARPAPPGGVGYGRTDDPLSVMDEILEEVRAIRRERQFADFSFMQLAGAIAQAFAACAVGFGLYNIADGDAERASVALLAGIAFQLMALTGFTASRRR